MHVMNSSAPSSGHLDDFDSASGSLLERALFNHRVLVLLLCLAATLLLGWQASRLTLNASFEKMIPRDHPFIHNYLEHRQELAGLGNAVRIAVANPRGSIYDKDYLHSLQQLNDAVYLLPGVDRAAMKSLWTPSTRWTGVTEEGLEGGPVVPDGYDGAAASLEALKRNVERSNEIGQLVAFDQRSSIVYVPLLEKTPDGQALDYTAFAHELETCASASRRRGWRSTSPVSPRSSATSWTACGRSCCSLPPPLPSPPLCCTGTPAACAAPRWWWCVRWWQ